MGDDTDILDELMAMLDTNGEIDRATRDHIQAKAMIEIIRRVRKIERESVIGIFRHRPVQATLVVVATFILLHEFATYINIGVFLRMAIKALGVPIP
jgi:hypothetical protein